MAPFSAVKFNLAGGETRRFPASALPLHSYAELRARLATEFPSASRNPEYALSYRDEEGDRVTICSQAEWEGALDCLAGQKVPCFTLSTTAHKRNGGEAPPPHHFLSTLLGDVLGMEVGAAGEGAGGDVNASVPLFEMFESIRPMVEEMEKNLEQQTKGGELPNYTNLPFPFPGVSPLFGFQTPAPSAPPPAAGSPPANTPHNGPAESACPCTEAHTANLDAVQLLESKDYEGAEAVLEVAIDRWPRHTASHYNMACAAALGGNPDKAIASLRKCFDLGYSNHRLLASDPDLDSLRALPEFNDLLASLCAPSAHGFHMGRYMHRCRTHGRHAHGASGLAALLRASRHHLSHPHIGARGVVSGVVCAAAVGQGELGLAALRCFADGFPAPSSASTRPCIPHGWRGLQKALRESEGDLALMSGLPGYEEFVEEVTRRAEGSERVDHHTTHCAHADSLPDEAFEQEKEEEPEFKMSCDRAAEESRATVSQSTTDAEATAAKPFPFAREFAEVRSIGIAVPDTQLRALLLSHGGDVSTVMSELCTTPR